MAADSGMDNSRRHPWSRIQASRPVAGANERSEEGKRVTAIRSEKRKERICEDRGASQVMLGVLPRRQGREEGRCVFDDPQRGYRDRGRGLRVFK